ncbi:MAG: hypothetical protein MUF35_12340 [Candidatus Nanopelagicales bacterium]|jgi:hypothetical protein|nr:hypothetical protein [Candidatus Nanopelagicales bacterium]
MRPADRARQLVNLVNLSTPAGLLVARLGGAVPRRGRAGLVVARGYRLGFPPAPAFTLGNVVLVRREAPPGADPIASIPVPLLAHEERHATQYAMCGGVLMPVLYLGAAAWSWVRTGDFGAANVFERRAGLADGGYRERPVRPLREALAEARAVADARAVRSRQRGGARRRVEADGASPTHVPH